MKRSSFLVCAPPLCRCLEMSKARPIYKSIVKKVTESLSPARCLVVDESAAHAGHAGVRDATQPETHFRAEIIAERFDGLNCVSRQRLVMGLLEEEFKLGLHALQLQCRTPAEEARISARKPVKSSEDVPAWVEDIGDWIQENDPLLLDVRTSAEVQVQPVAGALHVELGDLGLRIADVLSVAGGKDRPVGTFCAAGIRSQTALQMLESHGFKRVRNVHSAGLVNFLLSRDKAIVAE